MRVAFDFDGTLTDRDTILGFFLQSDTKLRTAKLLAYFAAACLCKVKVISNTRLKKLGVKFFLRGKTRSEVKDIGVAYARSIKLNRIYDDYMRTLTSRPIIISASFTEYLQEIFPEAEIIGSTLSYDEHSRVTGVAFNCYQHNKIKALEQRGIKTIDIFYTDNVVADGPVVNMSDCTYVVDKGDIKQKITAR